ncbi:helix-turn-helix transcriptional regulator [Stenotrophomonas sp. Sm6012]|uniref:helix-turn-helix domain-containing protein n=1 Tax=Stenotrophomonas sp. Sm6012 TaxID=3002745 RepID=UPI0027E50C09|nr:helix-turn-helix transcriptional regulator [Stenotrophomonas sp. Sm6012]
MEVPELRVFPRTTEEDTPNEHICAQMSHMPIQSPEEIAEALGRRIRARRLLANVSQASLADKAGISRRALVQLESGQGSTVHTLISTLKALGLEEQLTLLVPVPTVSPMAMLKAKRLRSRAS